jgi:hypothetical protein
LPNSLPISYESGYFRNNATVYLDPLDGNIGRPARLMNDYPNCPIITVGCWVRIGSGAWSADGGDGSIFRSIAGGKLNYDFGIDADGYAYVSVLANKRSGSNYGCPAINDGIWHMVVFQIDATKPNAVKFSILVDNIGIVISDTSDTINIGANVITNDKKSNISLGYGGFAGNIDELMVWDRILKRDQVNSILKNPVSLTVCVTQTPTATQTRTPSKTPTTTRSAPANFDPQISAGTKTAPATCAANLKPYCPGATVNVNLNNYGTFNGTIGSRLDIYFLSDVSTYDSNQKGLPYGTLLGSANRPTGAYLAGSGTTKLNTSQTYAFAAKNEYGQWSNVIFVTMPLYV